MGQISLPRLEKINTTMSWESTLLYNKERWASIKSFIFLKILIQFIFKNTKFKFKTKWLNIKKLQQISQFTYKYYYSESSESSINKKILLNHYIYQYKNKYILLVVYLK